MSIIEKIQEEGDQVYFIDGYEVVIGHPSKVPPVPEFTLFTKKVARFNRYKSWSPDELNLVLRSVYADVLPYKVSNLTLIN